jgi:hypothetical protein
MPVVTREAWRTCNDVRSRWPVRQASHATSGRGHAERSRCDARSSPTVERLETHRATAIPGRVHANGGDFSGGKPCGLGFGRAVPPVSLAA